MRVFNEFKLNGPYTEDSVKELIINDLSAKIGWIKGIYPNKADSENNLDIIFRQLSFEVANGVVSIQDTYVWEDKNEIFTKIVKILPISIYFFGKEFPKIKWFILYDGRILYTLI